MKIVARRGGYIFILCLLVGVLFVSEPVFAKQTPFNYTIQVRNQTNLIEIIDANCNLTIITTNPAPIIGNSPVPMANLTDGESQNGSYAFEINESWIQGSYATRVDCSNFEFTNSLFGSFVVGLETTDFRDLSIVGGLMLIAGMFIFLTFRSESKVLNPLFFFMGNLLIVIAFFASSKLTTNSEISSIMLKIYSVAIIIYAFGVFFYIIIGWFYPFVKKHINLKKTDEEVESEVF